MQSNNPIGHGLRWQEGIHVAKPVAVNLGLQRPASDVLPEHGIGKEAAHAPDFGYVPIGNVLVEARAFEHALHVRNVRDIPMGDIAVEFGASKHAPHVEHGSGVPLGDIPIEGRFHV